MLCTICREVEVGFILYVKKWKINVYFEQGIIDMNRNGNSANFFSYVCNDKKSKELFASF